MRGRRPKPTALKLAQGNPGKRRLNKLEPRPSLPDRLPEPPVFLGFEARQEWERVGGILLQVRILTGADLSALAQYCKIFGRWVEAERMVEKRGAVVRAKNGTPILNPHLVVANQTIKQMGKYLSEFGLTPSSRSRIAAGIHFGDGEDKRQKTRDYLSIIKGGKKA